MLKIRLNIFHLVFDLLRKISLDFSLSEYNPITQNKINLNTFPRKEKKKVSFLENSTTLCFELM